MTDKQRILDLIEKAIDSYERMLQKIVIEKDKEFNSTPYEKAVSALNQLLENELESEEVVE
jgi:hypothetical protein